MESKVISGRMSNVLSAYQQSMDGSVCCVGKDIVEVFEALSNMKEGCGEEEEGLAGRIGLVTKEEQTTPLSEQPHKATDSGKESEERVESERKRKVHCGSRDEEGDEKGAEEASFRKRRRRKVRRRALSGSSTSADDTTERARSVEDEQQFCLRWNNFSTNITSQFGTLRDDEDFVDVTLACGGMQVKAHRVVLSACSPYFKRMFKSVPYCQHPVVFLEGVHPNHLLSLLAFMYCGEVGVRRGQLPSLLSTAHALQIRGLTEMSNSGNSGDDEESVILSAKRQSLAVERALKDIGLSSLEKSSGSGCVEREEKVAFGRTSPVATRQRHSEMTKVDDKVESNPTESSGGPLSDLQMPPSPAKDVPAKKNQQVAKDLEEIPSTVNSPERSGVVSDMAANLVDIRMESPVTELKAEDKLQREAQTTDGDGLNGRSWDPGDSPPMDGLITPKEEEASLNNAIEAKMEYQDGEKLNCPVHIDLPSISLTPQHKFSSHVLGSGVLPGGVSSQLYFLPPVPPQGSDGGRGHLKWEMPRPCPVCRRIYSNNSNLRRHLRTIHEDYYEKYVQ